MIALISDRRIDHVHRVLWALCGVGGLRPSEAFRLELQHLHWELQPLGMVYVAKSKINEPRAVPMHPVLATILKDWLTFGWKQMMGREPKATDLLVPLPESSKGKAGRMRCNSRTLKDLKGYLDVLGFRQRRAHDLRHTMISLSRTDGAQKDILRRVTHKAPAEVIEGYTHFEWPVVCAEVMKLRLDLSSPATPPAAPNHAPVVSDDCAEGSEDFATSFATDALRQRKSPGSLRASEASSLRGVGDLNP